jgi:hypothetical protein
MDYIVTRATQWPLKLAAIGTEESEPTDPQRQWPLDPISDRQDVQRRIEHLRTLCSTERFGEFGGGD